MSHRFSQLATIHAAFAQQMGARLPVLGVSRPPLGSLALRPGDSLTILTMALSVGFIQFVSSTDATQATGLLTFAPVGLSPTEHASLRWTHWFPGISFQFRINEFRPLLRRLNSSYHNVRANRLTFGLNVRRSAT